MNKELSLSEVIRKWAQNLFVPISIKNLYQGFRNLALNFH